MYKKSRSYGRIQAPSYEEKILVSFFNIFYFL